MATCKYIKKNGKTCKRTPKKGMEYCWSHAPQQFNPGDPSDSATQLILQALYEQGIDAMNSGKYQVAIDWLSLVQRFADYRDVSTRLSEAKTKLAVQEPEFDLHRDAGLEHLALMFSVIFAFVSALINSTLTFIADVSRPWGGIILALLYLVGLAVILWSRKRYSSFLSTGANPGG